MKVKDLFTKLENFNPEAEVRVIVFNMPQEFSIGSGGAEGCTEKTADRFNFYVDKLNRNENR